MSAANQTVQITIDSDSGIPLWLQLRNRLIYLIASGRFQAGDKLPTVRELAVDSPGFAPEVPKKIGLENIDGAVSKLWHPQ